MKALRHLTAAAFVAVLASVAHAHGPVQCEPVAEAERKPQMELQKKLERDGWRIRQVKNYHDCYEVYGFDAKGERVEAFFHPKTFERIEVAEATPAR